MTVTGSSTPEDFIHLVPYGYAPGGYSSICTECGKQHDFCDKRATRCRVCATLAYEETASLASHLKGNS